MRGSFSAIRVRMRRAAFVSESAQWTTTSWTLHFPAPGRHESAAFGTLASASRIRSGPRAYCSMSAARSSGSWP